MRSFRGSDGDEATDVGWSSGRVVVTEIEIPEDVRAWIRNAFQKCNAKTAISLMQMPNTHEASLDLALVSQAAEFSDPIRFPSTWIVRIDTHPRRP